MNKEKFIEYALRMRNIFTEQSKIEDILGVDLFGCECNVFCSMTDLLLDELLEGIVEEINEKLFNSKENVDGLSEIVYNEFLGLACYEATNLEFSEFYDDIMNKTWWETAKKRYGIY